MITRITLDNFMSHTHTVIEPADGLTVITGPNNCGKSAVVEALHAVCENTQTDFMVRHGAKEAVVTLETDDGHTVIWRRRKTYASYTIDGEQNDRPGDDYLERVHAILRLPPVRASEGKDHFQVHFGTQKSPIFLLNESKLKQATFFASSSDAEKLLEMQRRHRARVAEDKKSHARLSAEIAAIDGRLATLRPLGQLLADSQILTARFETCKNALADIQRATELASSLRRLSIDGERHAKRASALQYLNLPPVIHDESPLAHLLKRTGEIRQRQAQAIASLVALKLLRAPYTPSDSAPIRVAIEKLKEQFFLHRRAEASVRTLQRIASPPPLDAVDQLENYVIRLKKAASSDRQNHSMVSALNTLKAPASMVNDESLAQLIERLRNAADAALRTRLAVAKADMDLLDARTEVTAWISENPKCPLCNGPLEAEQLLAAGGHFHD